MSKPMHILKSASTMLDQKKIFIFAYMYNSNKKDRSKNQYRYEGRIVDIDDLKKEIAQLDKDRVGEWKWPGIEGYELMYGARGKAATGANWLKARLKKTVSWPEFMETVKASKTKIPLTEYKKSSDMAGPDVSIESPEQLLQLNDNISRIRTRAESSKANAASVEKIY